MQAQADSVRVETNDHALNDSELDLVAGGGVVGRLLKWGLAVIGIGAAAGAKKGCENGCGKVGDAVGDKAAEAINGSGKK